MGTATLVLAHTFPPRGAPTPSTPAAHCCEALLSARTRAEEENDEEAGRGNEVYACVCLKLCVQCARVLCICVRVYVCTCAMCLLYMHVACLWAYVH